MKRAVFFMVTTCISETHIAFIFLVEEQVKQESSREDGGYVSTKRRAFFELKDF
jgi:hypothetical protein